MALLATGTSPAILYVTPEKIAKSKTLLSKLEACHRRGFLRRYASSVFLFVCFFVWLIRFLLDVFFIARDSFIAMVIVILITGVIILVAGCCSYCCCSCSCCCCCASTMPAPHIRSAMRANGCQDCG
jgi:hypothetical protein